MAVPLTSGDKVSGVLGIAYDDDSALEFGTEEVELLEALRAARRHRPGERAAAYCDGDPPRARQRKPERGLARRTERWNQYPPSYRNTSPLRCTHRFSLAAKSRDFVARKKLTVFFSDIADFTATTDS